MRLKGKKGGGLIKGSSFAAPNKRKIGWAVVLVCQTSTNLLRSFVVTARDDDGVLQKMCGITIEGNFNG